MPYTEEFLRYAIIAADIAGWKRGRVLGPHPGTDEIVERAKAAAGEARNLEGEIKGFVPRMTVTGDVDA